MKTAQKKKKQEDIVQPIIKNIVKQKISKKFIPAGISVMSKIAKEKCMGMDIAQNIITNLKNMGILLEGSLTEGSKSMAKSKAQNTRLIPVC